MILTRFKNKIFSWRQFSFHVMKPVLYYDAISPPVRSVLMLKSELKIDMTMEYVELFRRGHLTESFIKLNPVHTIPVLIHDNLILTDSHVILIYLAEAFKGSNDKIYPDDKRAQMKILNRLFFNCSILFKRDSDMMNDILHKKITNIEPHAIKLREAYSFLEIFLDEHKYMAGPDMTVADISILATLSTVDMVVRVEREKWPKLFKWYNEMKKLPYYEEANQKGIDLLKDKLNSYSKIQFD